MQHLIGEHEVDNSLFVDGGSEILLIPAREPCADSVMSVHHTSYTIESKTVKPVFVHPKAKVREQKPEDFVIAVIEKTTEINIQFKTRRTYPKVRVDLFALRESNNGQNRQTYSTRREHFYTHVNAQRPAIP
jgi:hypothetical protein